MTIRTEMPDDRAGIRAVHLASFPGPGEADMVDRLRQDGDAMLSLVAVEDGAVAGHVMFSCMTAPFRALGLGPVAVLTGWRRRGIAARLIDEGIRRARNDGWTASSFWASRPATGGSASRRRRPRVSNRPMRAHT